jgi:MFS transporter, NNP family, nitrate/nitrite transporter
MQILIPLVMTAGVFGAFAGGSMVLIQDSGTLIGKIPAGTETWIQNAGWVWLLFLVPLAFLGWFGMNNLLPITPNPGSPFSAFGKILGLYGVAFLAAGIGLYLYLPAPVGLGVLNMWLVILLTIGLTLAMLRMLPGSIQPNIKRQFSIFKDKHTWSMTVLYILTFGSFIGFSMALPLSITVIFGFVNEVAADGTVTRVANPNAPSALTYAWIGPFIGALIRPLGGWISDKVGGSIVTQVISVVMVGASVAAGYVMQQAYGAAQPEQYFFLFLVLFLVLFAATGIGNGSTFRSIGVIYDREKAGPVLGWTSAVGAYGSFVAPIVIGEQVRAGTPEVAMYAFAVFYALCLILNWWFYLRRGAYVKNP